MAILGEGTHKPLSEYMEQLQAQLDSEPTQGHSVVTGGVLWNNTLVDVGIVQCDAPVSIQDQVNHIARQLQSTISTAETVNEVSRIGSIPDITKKCGPEYSIP